MDSINKSSLTIIMPAYNESAGLEDAYRTASRAVARAEIDDYEIIIVTRTAADGTHDGTPDIADKIASQDNRVRHLAYKNVRLGYQYRQGVKNSTKDYVMMVPGDSDTIEDSLVTILTHIGEAPVISTYTQNSEARPLYIRFVSYGFVVICNIAFGLRMKYFNGISMHRRELLERIPEFSNSPAYMAVILIQLVKSKAKYLEIPQVIKISGPGKTFKAESVFSSLKALISLFWKINFKRMRVDIPPKHRRA